MFWLRETLMLTHLLHLEIIKSPRYFEIEQLFITTFQQNVPFILRWTVFIVEEYQEQGNQPSTGYEQIVDTFSIKFTCVGVSIHFYNIILFSFTV